MYLHKCPGPILLKLFVCVCMAQVFIPITAACIKYFTTYNGVVNIFIAVLPLVQEIIVFLLFCCWLVSTVR